MFNESEINAFRLATEFVKQEFTPNRVVGAVATVVAIFNTNAYVTALCASLMIRSAILEIRKYKNT